MSYRTQDGLDSLQVSSLTSSTDLLPIYRKAYFKVFFLICLNFAVVLFCTAAVIFPLGFHIDEIGGQPYQLPNSHQVGLSYIMFVLALWITVVSELFAGKVCLPHF